MSQPNKNSGGFLPQTLDVDDSIIDNNLKIIENKDFEDKITGIFPGLVNNANASTAKHYRNDRKLLPTDEYPTVQVLNKICNEHHVKIIKCLAFPAAVSPKKVTALLFHASSKCANNGRIRLGR